MATEEHKALIRRYLEDVWSKGNTDIIDQLLAPTYTLRVLQGSSGHQDRVATGTQRIKQDVEMYHRAFPDLQITPGTIVAEGNRVVVEWTARATHSGEFHGIKPTGKHLSYAGITIYRLVDGKIAEELYLGDRLSLWQQLGLVRDSHRLAAEVGRD
jgi:steroid delta-isomerase-like uncharacterized protein